jgi:WD40 repeat protein/predicted Ser/Thr protein kinase
MSSQSEKCSVCGFPKSGLLDGNCPNCLMRLGTPLPQASQELKSGKSSIFNPSTAGALRVLGDYELMQEIARGGMGVVYRARQMSLNRMVAVKVLLAGPFANETFTSRFRREAEAAASLNHRNIVSIYEVGEHDGQPYFSMQLIEGRSLAELVRDPAGAGLPPLRAAKFVKSIAEAVHFAHERGVLHRDLKPSNVLVDNLDVPYVTDFGLAKWMEGVADLTLTGQVLGTPNFMAPEQADPKRRPSAVSDVYSLGAILYQLLTGRPPFVADTITQTLRLVAETEPLMPRLLNPDLSRDLETICVKCLQKEPKRRYASALELADELGRFLNDEPIQARPISSPARLMRWCRRKPALASALGAGAVLLLAIAIGSPIAIVRINTARKDAQRAQTNEAQGRRRAEAQELAARKKAYASDMKLLQVALAADELDRAQELLNRQRPQPGEQDLRGWEWRYFWQFCQGDEAFTLCKRSNSIHSVSFSRDGSLLAVGGTFPNEVTIWDVGKRQLLSNFEGLPDTKMPASRLSFAPNSDTLAFYNASNRQGNIVLWDARSGKEMHRLPATAYVKSLAFSRDGRLFTADIRRSNNVTIWDPVQGKSITSFTANLGNVAVINCPHFAISGDGNRFADIALGFVQVTDANGRSHRPFRVADEDTTALEFSPDGETLVTAGAYAERTIKLWDVRTRQLLGSLEGHRAWVSCLKFLPDGKTLASASADRTVRLWNFESRQPIRTLRGHGGELWTIDASPDGRWLAGGGKDGSVMLWDLTASTNRPAEYRTPLDGTASSWRYSPDGRWLAVVKNGRLTFYDPTTFQLVGEPALPLTNIYAFAFSPDMRWLLATGNGRTLGCWDVQEQRMVTNFAAPLATRFVFNGETVLTHDFQGPVTEWDVSTWKQIRQWPVFTNDCWTFSPAAQLLGIAYRDGLCALIPIHDPDKPRRFKGQSRIFSMTLSPDGKKLAAASQNGTVELWDTETLTRRALLGGALHGFYSVMISPDGQRVAAGSSGKDAIKVWDLHSHEEVATLAGEEDGSHFISGAFSPDGNTIGASNSKGRIHLWTAPTWKQIEEAESRKKTAQ